MKGLRELNILDDKRHNPAIGVLYGQTPLGRTLIVGLSHYGSEEELRQPDFTHNLVEKIINGEWKIPYFTKIAKLFRDDSGEDYSVADFFSAVAFYNYLSDQFAKPRQITSQEQCKRPETQRFLFKVIDALRPDHLIVTGENLWRLLPAYHPGDAELSRVSDDSSNLDIPFESEERECFWYRRADGGYCLVGAITHPSSWLKFNLKRKEIGEWTTKFVALRHE
jgi:hypothetical protein